MNITIQNISVYLPQNTLSNQELEQLFPGFDSQKVYEKVGIKSRHIAGTNETALDLAEKACRQLQEKQELSDVDFLLLCTQSPDYILPTSACILQERLGLPRTIGALDYNLGCSGFVYGLALAKGLIAGQIARKVLLVTSETYSKHINPQDRGNRSIFGDGAAATLLTAGGLGQIGVFELGTDGRGQENLIIRNGGMKHRYDPGAELQEHAPGCLASANDLFMNGPAIFNFTIEVIPKLLQNTLHKNNLSMDQVDLFLFHQANAYMLNFLRKTTRIPSDKFAIDMEDTGNTVSASIPVLLEKMTREGSVRRGNKLLLAGFGVGYSYGGVVVDY